jgi:hypothetical protein
MLVTGSGGQYRALVLDRYAAHMSLPVLRSIQKLVQAGATVIGQPPVSSPSLADDQAAFTSLVRELWGPGTQPRTVGKGRVLQGDIAAAIGAAGLSPDTGFTKSQPDSQVLFVHRRTPDADIYFVDNRRARVEKTEANFRVAGKAPELWHADTGRSEPAAYEVKNGRTSVPLTLQPYETVFVVFRHSTTQTSRPEQALRQSDLVTVSGPWQVHFEEKRGEPESIQLATLQSWSEASDPGVRYFSGHGTYTTGVNVAASALAGGRVWLDLGDVANLAEVKVNGQSLGTVWKAPYRVDATSALHAGENQLEIRVVNSWVNRLIGDAQPDAKQKYTFTVRNPYKANAPLLRSGLLGPVRLVREDAAQ